MQVPASDHAISTSLNATMRAAVAEEVIRASLLLNEWLNCHAPASAALEYAETYGEHWYRVAAERLGTDWCDGPETAASDAALASTVLVEFDVDAETFAATATAGEWWRLIDQLGQWTTVAAGGHPAAVALVERQRSLYMGSVVTFGLDRGPS